MLPVSEPGSHSDIDVVVSVTLQRWIYRCSPKGYPEIRL